MVTKVTIFNCARCDALSHHDVPVKQFRKPVQDTSGDFTHWAECPTTGDPILVRVEATTRGA